MNGFQNGYGKTKTIEEATSSINKHDEPFDVEKNVSKKTEVQKGIARDINSDENTEQKENIAKEKDSSITNVKQKDDRPKSENNNQRSPKNKSHEASEVVLGGTGKEIKNLTSESQVVKKIDDSKDSNA